MEVIYKICCVLILLSSCVSSDSGPCKTPDNYDGDCIPLKQCSVLFSMISDKMTSAQRDFLRRSQCGSDGTVITVCCPLTFTENDFPPPGRCGSLAKNKLIGGTETNIGDYPWYALLHYKNVRDNREGFYCGGALIHENYVLTAAHCIRMTSYSSRGNYVDKVRLGEQNINTEPDCQDSDCADPVVDIDVAEIIVHEDYAPSRTNANDIALIRLARPAPYTDFVRPICLPFPADIKTRSFDGDALWVAGFGRTENATRSDVKLEVQLNGFNFDQCNNIYRSSGITLNSKHLCAGGRQNEDTCNGDSGGPLSFDDSRIMMKPRSFLVGVVSFGPRKCGSAGFPVVYSRVDRFIEWIMNHMRKNR